MVRYAFPGGARFAFTIIDDTDVATVENVAPVYALLERLGLRTTKTVWPCACPEGSRDFARSETLEDAPYRAFTVELQQRGYEIAFHGATMESSPRERTALALARFRETFGAAPRVHANHSYNRENLYWGADRLDDRLLRALYGRWIGARPGHYQGHVPGSPYWWGDLCAAQVTYVRNLTFNALDVTAINPSMPYHDPTRPWVPFWFSAADAEDRVAFDALLTDANVERLEREGGVCIVATHLGKGFASGGRVHPSTVARLEALARRRGWFVPVGDLLDWLRAQRGDSVLPAAEWRAMQRRWARDLAARKWRQRRAARRTTGLATREAA